MGAAASTRRVAPSGNPPAPKQAVKAVPASSVFLNGSCNPTTWRRDVAIPLLESAGVTYYNPQVDNWTPDMIDKEARAKEQAKVHLFVIDSLTRAIASMVEAAYYSGQGRRVVLVVHMIESPEIATGEQLKDLNRGRIYLQNLVSKLPNVTLCNTIEEAVKVCIAVVKGM